MPTVPRSPDNLIPEVQPSESALLMAAAGMHHQGLFGPREFGPRSTAIEDRRGEPNPTAAQTDSSPALANRLARKANPSRNLKSASAALAPMAKR